MMTWRGIFLSAAILLVLAGCAAPGAPAPATGEDDGAPASAPAERAPDAPAVAALQDQAEAASAEGDHDRAAALLERALRIEPRHSGLWHNLAVVQYRKGDYAQAENMAQRSLQHVRGDRQLERRNWELIAVSRELAGDAAGAREARGRLATMKAGSDS